jgi:hypothetical protein
VKEEIPQANFPYLEISRIANFLAISMIVNQTGSSRIWKPYRKFCGPSIIGVYGSNICRLTACEALFTGEVAESVRGSM